MLGTTTAQYLCSTCNTSFEHQHERREHMRTDWHVYNLKRKLAELPPISARLYDTFSEPLASGPAVQDEPLEDHTEPSESEESSEEEELMASNDCLFCSSSSLSMEENLDHMSSCHGFSIPNVQYLETDLETLLAYLALVICRFHACIYCGHEKHSMEAAQAHMLDKGHCMLDLSADSEFLEFWNSDRTNDYATAQKLSDSELRLQSGAVISGRRARENSRRYRPPVPKQTASEDLLQDEPERKIDGHNRTFPRPNNAAPQGSASLIHFRQRQGENTTAIEPRKASQRDLMGVIGLSDAQQRALAVTQRKAISQEFRSRSEAQWTLDRLGNKTKQKYFKACSIQRSGLFIDPCRR